MRRNDERPRRDSESTNFSSFDRGSFSSSPRDMHKAVCADCGKECEVPFEPKEGRPVYCKECYAKHRPKRF